jgi:hypothetical protein
MTFEIDTIDGNKQPSEKLKGLLVNLRNKVIYTLKDIENDIEAINIQARSEDYEDHEIDLLIRGYLSGIKKTKRQIRYILKEVPRAREQKKLIEKHADIGTDVNMQKEEETISLPTEHKVIISDQLAEELENTIEQQEQQQESFEEFKPDYALEDLRPQLANANGRITELTTQKKALEEKYRQLEARISNSIPPIQGNNLKTKIVINPVFREILKLKGSKKIYANIVIDISQNKYVRLEPA